MDTLTIPWVLGFGKTDRCVIDYLYLGIKGVWINDHTLPSWRATRNQIPRNGVMNIEGFLQRTIDYGQSHTIVVLGVGAILVLLTIFKPKTMMQLYGVCIVALIGVYLLTLIGGTISGGIQQKDKMIYKTPEAIDE